MKLSTILIYSAILIIVGIPSQRIWRYYYPKESTHPKGSRGEDTGKPQPYPSPRPAESPIIPDPVKDEGWLYTGSSITPNGMTQSWFTPTNKTGSTTWLPLKEGGQNHNYGYRVQQDTIIKFKSKESSKITVVKIDGKTFDIYKETSDGKFSTTVFQEDEFLPIRKDAESISFTPIQEPMIVKVWRAQ